MDGARLLNAVAKTGISPERYSRDFDTVWIDFSKGLGAPCGAVLAGSADFCRQAWRQKQALGGAMRQSGVLAAACIYALDNHMEQQSIDNDLAASIGERIVELPQVANMLPVDTNIIVFDVVPDAPTAVEIVDRLKERDVLLGAFEMISHPEWSDGVRPWIENKTLEWHIIYRSQVVCVFFQVLYLACNFLSDQAGWKVCAHRAESAIHQLISPAREVQILPTLRHG